MDISTPGRCHTSRKGRILPVLLLITIVFQVGCKNKSGITEAIDAPSITLTSPENNATDVAVNSTIIAVFDEEIDPATLTNNSFIIRLDTVTVNGTITYTDSTAVFSPSGNLEFGKTYTASITTDVQNLSGNSMDEDYLWTFTTAGEPREDDTTPPQVISTNPEADAQDVSINTSVSATFNELLNQSTINENTFSLTDGSNSVAGSISYSGTTATLSLSGMLEFAKTYTVIIDGSIEDTAGNSLGADFSWSFTTGDQPDNTPPQVISKNPEDDAQDVSINTSISATFNEPLNTSTVNANTFSLRRGSTNIPGTVSYSNNTVTLTPSQNLTFETTYTATLHDEIEDMAGNTLGNDYNWEFTTSSQPDNTPPRVTETNPDDNEDNVSISSTITVTFNEPINSSSIDSSTFVVRRGNNNISGSYNSSGNSVTFTPSSPLSYEASYTAMVTTGVEDMAGNALEDDFEWTFETGDEPDNEDPEVDSTNPTDNQNNVTIETNVTVNFNEAINPSTVNNSTFFLRTGGSTISASHNSSGSTVTLTPNNNLSYETDYTVTLTTGIEDLAGNNLAQTQVWEFTTEDEPDLTPPSLTGRNPQPNSTDVAIETNITATFSEAISSSSINSNTFVLEQGNTQIPASYNVSGNNTAVLNPSQNLAYGTTYTVTLNPAIEDLAGNIFGNTVIWNFTTEPEPDNNEPEVISRNPSPNQNDVGIGTNVTVNFNEAINPSSVTNSTFVLRANGSTIPASRNTSGSTVTLNPSSDLSYETTYTVTLTSGIEDLAGNGLANAVIWDFQTEEEPDNVDPEIDSRTPDINQQDVAINTNVIVNFSEAIDQSTVNGSTFLLEEGNTQISAGYSTSGSTATLNPNNNLNYQTVYTVTLTSGIQDLAGNGLTNTVTWDFTTVDPPDTTPPSVNETTPTNNDTNVAISTNITATFNEPMNEQSVEDAFSISPSVNGTPSFNNDTFSFNPDTDLEYETTYTATISTDAQDQAGNNLQNQFQWSFTTSEAPDTTPPSVNETTPTNNATNVAISTNITATFDEPMNEQSVENAFSISPSVNGTPSFTNNTFSFNPDTDLEYETIYTATILTDAQDLAGNNLQNQFQWSFTTVAETTENISSGN